MKDNEAKLQKKKEQQAKSFGFIKNQNNELRGIIKKITKPIVQKLYQLLSKQTPEKIKLLVEAVVGLIRN